MMYNNPYLSVTAGTAKYLVTNYLAWMNKYSDYKISGFTGVP